MSGPHRRRRGVPFLAPGRAHSWFRWDLTRLADELTDFECVLVAGSRPALATETQSIVDYLRRPLAASTFTVSRVPSPDDDLPGYLRDVAFPNPLFSRGEIAATALYHARAGTTVAPHAHVAAFNLLGRGTKQWVLWDADPHRCPVGWEALKAAVAALDEGTDAGQWFRRAPAELRSLGLEVVEMCQRTGDVVHVPRGFAHAVLDIEDVLGAVVFCGRPEAQAVPAPRSLVEA